MKIMKKEMGVTVERTADVQADEIREVRGDEAEDLEGRLVVGDEPEAEIDAGADTKTNLPQKQKICIRRWALGQLPEAGRPRLRIRRLRLRCVARDSATRNEARGPQRKPVSQCQHAFPVRGRDEPKAKA